MYRSRRKLVRFTAIKTIAKPIRVRFITSDGTYVSFPATKTVRKRARVRFYSRR